MKNPWRHFTCRAINVKDKHSYTYMNSKPLWPSMNDDWGLSEQEFIYHVKRLLSLHNVTIFIYGSSGKVSTKLTISNSQCFTKTKQKHPFRTETRSAGLHRFWRDRAMPSHNNAEVLHTLQLQRPPTKMGRKTCKIQEKNPSDWEKC